MREIIEKVKHQVGNTAFPFVSAETFSIGMTLRDYFAAKAMNAMMASPELMVVVTADQVLGENAKDRISNLAYQYADAMLKARDK